MSVTNESNPVGMHRSLFLMSTCMLCCLPGCWYVTPSTHPQGCSRLPLCALCVATRDEEHAVSIPLQGPFRLNAYATRPLWYGYPFPAQAT
jgi:hypothetical protein